MTFDFETGRNIPPPDDEHPFYNDQADEIRELIEQGHHTITTVVHWHDPYASFTDVILFKPTYSTLTVNKIIRSDGVNRWMYKVAKDSQGRYVSTALKEDPYDIF